jgi:hypothetical protein
VKTAHALKVICMWCFKQIGYRPCIPAQDGKKTHGGCRECWKIHGVGEATPEMIAEWDRLDESLRERSQS